MNPTTTQMATDGVAIQQGIADIFIGVLNLFLNVFVVIFQSTSTSIFTGIFKGLFGTSM